MQNSNATLKTKYEFILYVKNWQKYNKLSKIIQWIAHNKLYYIFDVGKKKWKACDEIWNCNFQL
jgi:hypothetical protein